MRMVDLMVDMWRYVCVLGREFGLELWFGFLVLVGELVLFCDVVEWIEEIECECECFGVRSLGVVELWEVLLWCWWGVGFGWWLYWRRLVVELVVDGRFEVFDMLVVLMLFGNGWWRFGLGKEFCCWGGWYFL